MNTAISTDYGKVLRDKDEHELFYEVGEVSTMARKVFFSFHYRNDISRVMVVRNRWVTYGGQLASQIIDKADFEQIKLKGDAAVKRWIDNQMDGTTATVVLIGSETLKRPYVQYEIRKSIERGNALIGVYINRIRDLYGFQSCPCPRHTVIGTYSNGRNAHFDEVADAIYDYEIQNGYSNLHLWVDDAVRKH